MPQPLFDFEDVNRCILCDSREQHVAKGIAWLGVGFSYSLCKRCGLKYMNPRPTEASYQIFYRDNYWQQNMNASGFASVEGYDDPERDQLELRMPKYRRTYRQVAGDLAQLLSLGPQHRVLEVGCAFGFSLEWLKRDFGCQVYGIEPSSEAVERCRQGDVPIIAGTAEEYLVGHQPADDEERYDVILFRHVLDTLVDPVGVISGARDFLKDDGILAVYCVNGEYYDAMDPYHPFLYRPQTLHRLFALCGLKSFRIEATPEPASHGQIVEILQPSYQIAGFARRGEVRRLPTPALDPIALVATLERGQQAQQWSHLSAGDLLKRLRAKLLAKLRRTLGAGKSNPVVDRLPSLR